MLEITSKEDEFITYFKAQFQELRQELGAHSALLSTMNDNVQRLTGMVQSLCCGSLQCSQDKLQDSIDANPKKLVLDCSSNEGLLKIEKENDSALKDEVKNYKLSLIHICRCRRLLTCRSRWSPYH
eukprot:TRINITY_DN13460_c0_g1_i9.p1 TRINITY_DN13460_c0_g1~~TRINITY_DN13460_c0_g1_i9.p1  ORF type:complete len:126 (-),score=35.88 TRINITY_DN13460_c0_g1_i9:39-416(-)